MKRRITVMLAVMLGIAMVLNTGAEMTGNPMTEVSAQELTEYTGITLTPAEGAGEVRYFVLDADDGLDLAEVQFTYDGAVYELRAGMTMETEPTDISGMYYDWTDVEPVTVSYCQGIYESCDEAAVVYWIDVVPGIAYSLSTDSFADAESLRALAENCFTPMQSDAGGDTEPVSPEMDSSDFVLLAEAVPDALLEIRYYSTYNFVGDRIEGYEEPVALLTQEAAQALAAVSDDVMAQGYRLKIYDAYRPQRAVSHFARWAEDLEDTRMKEYFYPELDKSVLFDQGYIAYHSGHSRGSTVDLTLFDMQTGKEADMGGTFDYFGEISHPDYSGELTEEQIRNRNILRNAMVNHGFRPLSTEWWHFTLEDEPYTETYFDFTVSSDSVY